MPLAPNMYYAFSVAKVVLEGVFRCVTAFLYIYKGLSVRPLVGLSVRRSVGPSGTYSSSRQNSGLLLILKGSNGHENVPG